MLLVAGAVALGSLRIVATYTVFNHTVDEPAHIACGMEWLERGTYRMEDQHPPLARFAAALGPYLSGIRLQGVWDRNPTQFGMYDEGQHIYYAGDHYDRTLVLSRLGVLPFFWVACLAVYFWARRFFGIPTAVVSVWLFSFLPAVLAHAGLGTTDMALTAFVGAAFVAMLAWAENPTLRRSALFGVAGALAVLSKFSSLVFFPAAAAVALLAYLVGARPGFRRFFAHAGRLALPLAAAGGVAILAIWAGYRFHFGPSPWAGISLPAPELYSGIRSVIEHNRNGHLAYLLGHHEVFGWWYFFPVVLAVKTPLPFLALSGFGAAISLARWRQMSGAYLVPLGFALAILGVGMAGHINVGLRHILPIYLGLAIMAAIGTVRLYELARRRGWAKAAFVVLTGWFALTSLGAHPDYLPYFNAIAGDQPERIVADSDLDWGQDMTRLATRLREIGAASVTFQPLVFDFYDRRGLPPMDFGSPLAPSPGWNAVSLTMWKVMRMGVNPPATPWPDRTTVKPVERVGKGMLLYYFPPAR
ncbi:MAG: glycosyltransferase family 39 protein [Bryobacteraceae bacterium]|jgi:hypothetical protein